MASNFDFLLPHLATLHTHATSTEKLAHTDPRACCFYARFTLEQAVNWLYDRDTYLQKPTDRDHPSLNDLLREPTFQDNLKPGLAQKLRIIQRRGNYAVHENTPITPRDALQLTEELFHFLYWIARYYSPNGKTIGDRTFDPSLLPRPTAAAEKQLTQQQIQTLETQLTQAETQRRQAAAQHQQTATELAQLRAELAALKQQNSSTTDTHHYNEAATREFIIDLLLREAGWDISQSHIGTEVELDGMPISTNPTGKGRADYVLWGQDGSPLAVIEAKRTSKNPHNGQHQAKLYADCLEQRYGQRPIIFYSNGDQTWIWDDQRYPPRPIDGFLKPPELERIIFNRTNHKKLHLVQINPTIAGRTYQTEAIRRITDEFSQKNRKSLLVMATGTGKTRTAIALVDLLMRANWVKRVLFLADRNALLTQALRAFKTHLPNATTVDLTQTTDPGSANIVLSTYPTMYNRLDRMQGDQRQFGPGHFDLVIVDEAHRSIYQKYSALFTYFDSLLIGLTATPRDEVHRDTYRIFEHDPGIPSFAYELDDAIADKHLVPPRALNVPFKFLRQGIKYHELSDAEKAEYETRFRDESGDLPPEINAAALNRWLFNKDTVDKALEILMTQGLKIDGAIASAKPSSSPAPKTTPNSSTIASTSTIPNTKATSPKSSTATSPTPKA
jgi:type I restriction enzyme, R subunit